LKKTVPLAKDQSKRDESHGVAALLMRRAALEESDSDHGSYQYIYYRRWKY
jgi:hypothetical protein